ncbi:class II glutamine amidotransferase [Acidiphilium acidophilum]|uniref:class II glutamine amidotransferase n=1 Tax=Acidiphilium acidophilum TaxID=76588 RepID=UPI00386331A2
MCELLGISTRIPTRVALSMSALAAHGDPARHLGDGWGGALHDGADAFDRAPLRGVELATSSRSPAGLAGLIRLPSRRAA